MMGGNLIAWIKEEFFLFIVTNNKDVSGRLLLIKLIDLASFKPEWTGTGDSSKETK